METFDVNAAIKIQQKHLAEWKTVLTEDAYNALEKWAIETNNSVKNPYNIRRGTDLGGFVQGYAMSKVN